MMASMSVSKQLHTNPPLSQNKKKVVYWKHETGLMLSWGRGKGLVICNLASTYVTMVSRKKILAIKFVAKVACLARRYFKYLVILDAW